MRLDSANVPMEEVEGWDVRDANTGLKVMSVFWADDDSHEVCRFCWTRMTEVIDRMPKVVILRERKLILVNVRDDLRDESLFASEDRTRLAEFDRAIES